MARRSLLAEDGAPQSGAPMGEVQPGAPRSDVDRGRAVGDDVAALVGELAERDLGQLALCWRNHLGGSPPAHLPRWLMARLLAYRIQAAVYGDLDRAVLRRIRQAPIAGTALPFVQRKPVTREGVELSPGALLVREWKGRLERVMILEEGFAWNGTTYASLSMVAKAITGASWNGHRFFGLRRDRAA